MELNKYSEWRKKKSIVDIWEFIQNQLIATDQLIQTAGHHNRISLCIHRRVKSSGYSSFLKMNNLFNLDECAPPPRAAPGYRRVRRRNGRQAFNIYQRGFHLDNPCNNISDGCVHVLFNGRHVTVSGTIQQTKVKRTSLHESVDLVCLHHLALVLNEGNAQAADGFEL